MDQLAAIVQSQPVHIGDLALVLVGADGLAEFVGVSDDVQHIVPDLEGQTQLIAVGFCCLPGRLAAAGCADAQHTGSGDHGTGFQVVDLRQFILGRGMVQRVQHLPRYHAVRAGRVRQNQSAIRPLGVGQAGSRQDHAVGRRLESVSRQYRQGLTVNLVVGGFTPAEIVIIHAGQVIMDQRIRVDQLQCAANRHSLVPVQTAQPGKLQRHHRTQPLAAGENAVPHGLIEVRPVWLFRKQAVQIVLDGRQIFLILGAKRSLFHVNPPYFQRAAPPARRQAPSSA